MPDYRRAFVPGGTFFFTLCVHKHRRIFANETNVQLLRNAVHTVKTEWPFEIVGAVVLPDHLHWIWTLPPNDSNYSRRIGRIKAIFTRQLGEHPDESTNSSRVRHRESEVWQRRFWEHAIRDQPDLENHLNYIHYNPVRHGWAKCPHQWKASSFRHWVAKNGYESNWCCACDNPMVKLPYPATMVVGE